MESCVSLEGWFEYPKDFSITYGQFKTPTKFLFNGKERNCIIEVVDIYEENLKFLADILIEIGKREFRKLSYEDFNDNDAPETFIINGVELEFDPYQWLF